MFFPLFSTALASASIADCNAPSLLDEGGGDEGGEGIGEGRGEGVKDRSEKKFKGPNENGAIWTPFRTIGMDTGRLIFADSGKKHLKK